MTNVTTKLSKLDTIAIRLNILDKQFSTLDTEMKRCMNRLDALGSSAQFLSDVIDEQVAI